LLEVVFGGNVQTNFLPGWLLHHFIPGCLDSISVLLSFRIFERHDGHLSVVVGDNVMPILFKAKLQISQRMSFRSNVQFAFDGSLVFQDVLEKCPENHDERVPQSLTALTRGQRGANGIASTFTEERASNTCLSRTDNRLVLYGQSLC
jgi:hypothetical protein